MPLRANPFPIFIGYDARERDAFEVCRFSLQSRTSVPLAITPLDQQRLRAEGLYKRQARHENGQFIDSIDNRPFSTEFSFSRFLVPALANYRGWALYCDCDFLFTANIAHLIALADPACAAMVVKHDYEPAVPFKMDGRVQEKYPRKNWSSLVLWNCGHPSNQALTIEEANGRAGRFLQGFSWLRDDEIGNIPVTWNWLSGVSPALPDGAVPNAIHFTLGGPWFENCSDYPYAGLWAQERARAMPGRCLAV